ncbi:caspase family protein [Polaribacter aquimarinus]|uniref:Peptidase C14 caspase domain-containing protein n=1 Tax=Polaribacter aquimarinus TaxID=2100726 RepID=A0A2U2J7Q2_9FLAO|nr:caspase family protein [Polaribacter aquimarinus]PWG04373.1 hypothetical protein DIS07_13285 [Polaribacter aquimarinus]
MKLLKKILLLSFFITSATFSQSSNNVYQENFSSKGSWPTGSNDIRELNVFNGRYYFEHKRNEKSWRILTSKFDLDTSKDFELETSIQKISGTDNYGICFLYDFKDGNNYRELAITSNGHFRVSKNIGGSFSNIKAWTKSSKIKTGNYGVNELKITKKSNTITFYINGSSVHSMSHDSFVGRQMGIMLYRNQKISVDYIKAVQKSSNNNNNNNNNNSYKTKTIVYDSFYSNRNNWAISNGEKASLEIKNSKYYFQYTGDKGWTTTKGFNFDTSRDFKVEASFQKVSGVKNNGFGLVFGRKDGSNQHQFLINALGSYSIDKYEDGNLNTLVNWTKSSSIKKENYSTNILKIEKRGSKFYYFVNNSLVHTASYMKVYGNRYGFSIFDPQKIAVDYISISYLGDDPNNNNIFKDDTKLKGDLLFSDNFDSSNINKWTERNDENTEFRLSNGKYYVRHKRKDKGWSTNISKYFDSSNDFEIETKIDKISGVTNNAYGLMWGLKDSSSFRFYLASSGYYKIVRVINGNEEVIVKWTKSSSVNQNNGASNILKVKRDGEYYKFYINNRYITRIDFEPFFGDRIGYVVYNDQEIAVDYLKIYSSKKKNNTDIVTTKTLTLPVLDNFNGNTNGWNLEDSDDYSAAIVNGKFRLHKKKKGGIFISRNVNIDTSKDFIIETSIARVTNSSSGLYGITFGRKNSSNEYSFLLSGNGSYMFRKFDNDKYKKIIPFTETSAIKTGLNDYNKIKIVKAGQLLRFFINGQYVNETAFEGFFGNKFGYTIYYDKKLSVDYLDIKYQSASFNNPPVVVITSPNVEQKRGFKIVEAKRIQVRGRATDTDGIFEITVNGVEANVSDDGTFTANVPLKYGKNDLIVTATDMKQSSSTKTFTIKRKSKNIDNTIITNNDPKDKIDVGFGKYYALIIGVSDYKDESIVDLNGEPTKDADALANVLTTKYSFSRQNVTVLKNPTENQIIKEFYNLRKKVGPNDNLVIFYAGHGNYDEASEKGYWMPSDAEMEFEGNVILNTSIVSYIKSINSKHTLLIADACFSGSILTKTRSFSKASNAVKAKYALPSRRAITSGTLTTVPNKSVFMKYLLKRLRENSNTYLSAGQLFNMIEDPVINNTSGNNKPQYAPISRTGDEGGDFIFIKRQ